MTAQAKISELKNRLSHYLDKVRRGEPVLVLDRDRVIARIEPAGGDVAEGGEARWLDELERRGVVRRSAHHLPRGWLSRRPAVKADLLRALLEEREEGR